LRTVPIVLFTVGALAGSGGAVLGTKGARDQVKAHERKGAADRQYQQRKDLSDHRRAAANHALTAFAQLQRRSNTDIVQRMVEFLHRNDRKVRESERVLVDGIDVTATLMPTTATDEAEIPGWVTAAIGTLAAGTGTATVLSEVADKFGNASTGTALSELRGIAKEKATRAFYGGGSEASGGGGMALGDDARNAAIAGSALLAIGLTAKVAGTRALTQAKQHEVARAVDSANLDLDDTHLQAVRQRVEEVSEVLEKVHAQAVAALDELESVDFHPAKHAELFQKAMTLVKAVQDVAGAHLVSADGSLTDESEKLTVRYRR
jgi:hypothetical protein